MWSDPQNSGRLIVVARADVPAIARKVRVWVAPCRWACACVDALSPEADQKRRLQLTVTNFHGACSTPQNVTGHTNAGDSQQGTRCHKRERCTQCCAAKGQLTCWYLPLTCDERSRPLFFRRSTANHRPSPKVYLYVADDRVVGCLVAKPIRRARRRAVPGETMPETGMPFFSSLYPTKYIEHRSLPLLTFSHPSPPQQILLQPPQQSRIPRRKARLRQNRHPARGAMPCLPGVSSYPRLPRRIHRILFFAGSLSIIERIDANVF